MSENKLKMLIKSQEEIELSINTLLEMRFGDGTGSNLQVKLATKDIIDIIKRENAQISQAEERGAKEERERILGELPVLKNTVDKNQISKGGRERLRIYKKGFDFAISLLTNKLT